jgi:uncharacterized membrane protein
MTEPDPETPPTEGIHAVLRSIQNRILSGLILALPIVLTIWIVYSIYVTLQGMVLEPVSKFVSHYVIGDDSAPLPFWWRRVIAPLIAVSGVLTLLYFLGYLVRSRVMRLVDWVLLHVPGVTTIYQALQNLMQSLDSQRQAAKFKRVVLVTFPHPGMRSLGVVTNSLKDAASGRTILCVCVLTGVFPPTGFTLFVPEEEVTDIDWTVNQSLQAIVSGGITSPASVGYYKQPPPR